jgi:ribosomal protein S18 acetylase RimI-like enzyme
MTEAEYPLWFDDRVTSYAHDLAAASGMSIDIAMKDSENAYQELLPAGLDSPQNWLWQVVVGGLEVGSLWLGLPRSDHYNADCWVYHILIDEDKRSRGFGTRALFAAETFAQKKGYRTIGLNVFNHNPRARELYERLGYTVGVVAIGRVTMTKSLTED